MGYIRHLLFSLILCFILIVVSMKVEGLMDSDQIEDYGLIGIEVMRVLDCPCITCLGYDMI